MEEIIHKLLRQYLKLDLRNFDEDSYFFNRRNAIVLGGLCFIKLLIIDIILGHGGHLICLFIGFVYPAYRTTKAIEYRDGQRTEMEIIKWLMYWVVFAAFHLLEFFSDFILGWVPFYWLAKCLFLLICMSPLNISTLIYQKFVLPLFRKNEALIDHMMIEGRQCVLEQCKKHIGLLTAGSDGSAVPLTPRFTDVTNLVEPSSSVNNSKVVAISQKTQMPKTSSFDIALPIARTLGTAVDPHLPSEMKSTIDVTGDSSIPVLDYKQQQLQITTSTPVDAHHHNPPQAPISSIPPKSPVLLGEYSNDKLVAKNMRRKKKPAPPPPGP